MAIGRRNLKNNWSTTLQASASSGATTLSLPQPWIDKLTAPDPSAADWYELTLDDGAQAPEIVRCTGKGTGTVTVVRAQQGTTAPTTWASGTKVEIRATAELLRVAEFSLWHGTAQTLAIGPSAGVKIAGGANNVLLGRFAGYEMTIGGSNTGIGDSALGVLVSGSSNTGIGFDALGLLDAGASENTAVGRDAGASVAAATLCTLLGAYADLGNEALAGALCLGAGATAYTSNVAVIGSEAARLTDVYIGGGQRDQTAAQVTLQASAGRGTDKAGGDLRIAGGKSTGTGAPGKVIVATGTAGASGSTENTLTNRAEWDTAGLFWTYAGLKTGNPGAGAGTWKLGTVRAGTVALDTANYVEVDIGGTVVKLLKAA